MAFTSLGKKKFAAHVLLILLSVAVVVTSARVNIFQEFFFMADLFPLILSSVTLFLLVLTLMLDLVLTKTFFTVPIFEVGLLSAMTIIWLAFNIFSTVRWQFIPLDCASIPPEYDEERVWCRDVQALKSFVWTLFAALLLAVSFIVRYAWVQHRKGNTHVWTTSLSRFRSRVRLNPVSVSPLDRATVTDYFGTSSNAWRQQQQQPWEKF